MYFYIISITYDGKEMYLKGKYLAYGQEYASRYKYRRSAERAFRSSEYSECKHRIVPYFVPENILEAMKG